VIGVNGVFGERMCDVAGRCGADVVRVEAAWGSPIEPAALAAAHPSPAIIAVVHAETSTGVRNDIAPLGELKGDALLLVDCVTSLGGIPVEIDGWGVDIAYSGTQKCLGCPPGLAPLTVSERARARLLEKPASWYLDLNMIARYVAGEGARAYHHTAPISMVFALHAALGAVLDEGLERSWARHAAAGEQLQSGLRALGMELFAAEGHRLPELTTVWVPEQWQPREGELRSRLLADYGIEVGGGLGSFAGKVWRIGVMGHTARTRNVTLLLAALADLLS
jgi:alanine-glyoxylate transaminase/serine-glyoxylate transaminase/serine-pyruvate transaminase